MWQSLSQSLSQGTGDLDLAVVTNEFVSNRNATLPCCSDEISQNLQKELFLSLINNHHNKVHAVMVFSNNPFPDMTTVGGLKKGFCPLPLTPPLTRKNETSYRGPCALLNVNKVQKQSPGGVI